MIIQNADNKQIPLIYELYMEAFPEEERKPFKLIEEKAQQGEMEILSLSEEGQFIGLAITVIYKDMVLIDYFAIAPNNREKGLGSKALELLKGRYKDYRLFLEIELADEKAQNNEERIRRKAFYHKNGLSDAKVYVSLFGVEMELLTVDCQLTYEEYYGLYEGVFGKKIASNVTQLV